MKLELTGFQNLSALRNALLPPPPEFWTQGVFFLTKS